MVKIADFIEAPNSGGDYKKVLLVVHDTEGPETIGAARGVVAFWNRARSGSTQYVVDGREIIQGVRETAYAWAAGTTANKWGIHVEHVGFAAQTGRQWDDAYSRAELALSAGLFAELGAKHGIPLRRLTVDQIRHAVKTGNPADGGICGHADISKAFPGETSHTDPGPNFPWAHFLDLIHAAAKAKTPVAPVVKPKPAPPKKTPHLVIATGNLFKDNTHKPADVALLDEQHAHVFGLNEAFRFHALLEGLKNYQVVSPGTGPALNNPVLIRNGLKVTGSGTRSMCAKVGSSPERTAVWAEYEFAGKRWAHVQTHSNAHIENGGQPRVLPRVTQNIAHMKNLDVLVRSLKAQGFKVTVGGDFNWAWTANPKAWTWAPKRVFSRLGMYVNWANKSAPKLASLGSRRVDYLAHGRDDLRIVSQRYITGEHSDHRWPEVTYRVIG